jgi:thiol-disulfide isomerase/thioredoxin
MRKTLLTLFLSVGLFSAQAQIQNYNVGDVVTDFTVTDVNGVQHNLYTYTSQGKYVWLDFFFVDCPPCQSTTPIFNEFYDKYGCNSEDVICIAINNGNDDNAKVTGFKQQFGGSFNHSPAISNEGGCAAVDTDFGPAAYPTYCIVGPDNKLKNSDIWPIADVTTFEGSFPTGFSPSPMPCGPIGIEEDDLKSYSIYPNPGSKTLNIDLLTSSNTVSISIVDLNGKTLLVKDFNSTSAIKIDHELPSGSYIVNIKTKHSLAQEKLVVL